LTDEEKEKMLPLLEKVSKKQPIETTGDFLQKFFADGLQAVTKGMSLERATLSYGTRTTGSSFKKDSKHYNKYIEEIEKEAQRVKAAKEEEERKQRERAEKQAEVITPRTMDKIVSLPAH